MNKIAIFLFCLLLLSCSKEQQKFDLFISNADCEFDIKSGQFKIDWYKNYKSIVNLSAEEQQVINNLIYRYHIQNIKGEKYVFGQNNLIMPNFNDEITVKSKNLINSKIIISTQVNPEISSLTSSETDVFYFKEELFKLLDKNKDYRRNMDTVQFAKKKVRRLFL